MATKMYFLAPDKQNKYDLWVTDGTTTQAVGGIGDGGVSGVSTDGLGPAYITAFGQQMIFAGEDALNNTASNGIWLTDGTAGGTTEVGGVSPGTNKSSPFTFGNPSGLNPQNFVVFGGKALFTGNDSLPPPDAGIWVTDGTVGGTLELGGLANGQIVGRGTNWSPTNFSAFGNQVLFNAWDASNGGDSYRGLWITDGTTAGTVEIGGLQNAAIFDSNANNFEAINDITLGGLELFDAASKDGNHSLWITDGTAAGTVEIGGVDNAGIVGADKKVGLGDGLANAVRLGARIFFGGPDNSNDTGLWVTDGTASGTYEIGGEGDAGLTNYFEHPSSLGLQPTNLATVGGKVFFNGVDAIDFNELWVSDGTAPGTVEIGGEGPGGALANEASNGLNPKDIIDIGGGKAVFVGYDKSNNQNQGKATLWVTDGTFAGTQEIGGLNNQGVAGINAGGFSFTSDLVGGDGFAYFIGEDSSGNFRLWETNGTQAGTKIVAASDGNAPTTGLYATGMTMGNPPPAEATVATANQTVNLGNIPGENLAVNGVNGVTVNGSNGTISLSSAQIAAIGGGLLINMAGYCAATLSNTNGNRDSVYMPKNNPNNKKGAVTLNGAQANVTGQNATVTFGPNTPGNVVFLHDTQGTWDNVSGSGGTVHLDSAKANVTGGGDTVYFDSGTGNDVSLYATAGNWDAVYASNAPVEVNASQVSVIGGNDTVSASAGSSVSLYQTNGAWDLVNASSSAIYLNGVQASIVGGGDVVQAAKGSAASLYHSNNNWDGFTGSGCWISLTAAQAAISGGDDTILLDQASSLSLSNTAGHWDGVTATNDTIILTGAQAAISGKNDVIWANAGSSVSLSNTAGVYDTVNASNETVILNGAQASVLGGGDTVYMSAGSAASLYNTSNNWDGVSGSGAYVTLNSAQAQVTGSNDTMYMSGASALNLIGSNEHMYFQAKMGVESIGGFNASDVLNLSVSDWANFSALQSSGAITGSNGSTTIKLDASDSITLWNVAPASLTASQIKFA